MIPRRLLGKACGSSMCLMFTRSERRLTGDELSAGALYTGCSGLPHAVAPLHCDTWGAAPHLRRTREGGWELDTGLHQQVDPLSCNQSFLNVTLAGPIPGHSKVSSAGTYQAQ